MNTEKVCPLLSMGEHDYVYCRGEGCAWYLPAERTPVQEVRGVQFGGAEIPGRCALAAKRT